MQPMRNPLPPDFRDRPHRWFWNVMILFRRRQIKAECCESFRKVDKMRACKGCPTRYDRNSPSLWYRFLAAVGKRKLS